jgi:hypothetical protein
MRRGKNILKSGSGNAFAKNDFGNNFFEILKTVKG